MKKIFFALFLWTGIVQASTTNYVWIGYPNGNLDIQCRTIWNAYDLKYGTNTVFFVKPGADGIIAIQDMLNFSSDRKFVCAGSGEVVSNSMIHPNDNSIDRIEPLLQTVVNSMVWYVPNNNKSQTFPELIAYLKNLNRPINVGVYFSTQRGISYYLEKTYDLKINLINYRTGSQMYPDLASGTLDLAFDSGGAIDIAQDTKKFRIAGYLAIVDYERLKDYQNFKSGNTNFSMFFQWLGIIIPKDMKAEDKDVITTELRTIVFQQSFKELALRNLSTVTAIGQPKILDTVHRQKKLFKEYWK
jgi:tripartite-type tricarboxylate transporter receptor subunit TctC